MPVLTKHREEGEATPEISAIPAKEPGTLIGRHYKVISYIGEGGASAVYKVRHEHLEKEFAIKVLLSNRIPSDTMIKRFQQEGRSIARLKHKGIVAVHEFSLDDNNQPFLVMDLLEGKTLSDLTKETGGLPPMRAAAIFQQIAEAMEHAHNNSVIHRDLKPNNVVVLTNGQDQDTVKLVDFGIAKLEEDVSSDAGLTRTGEIFGSPNYMSPEQCKGRSLDARADIYSFGCLMYETLTGKPAAQADNVFETLMLHLNGLALNLDETDCGMTLKALANLKKGDAVMQYKCFAGLKQVIDGCIQVAPEKRYQNMSALKRDLTLIRGGNAPQGPSSAGHSIAQKYLWSSMSDGQAERKAKSFREEVSSFQIFIASLIGGAIIMAISVTNTSLLPRHRASTRSANSGQSSFETLKIAAAWKSGQQNRDSEIRNEKTPPPKINQDDFYPINELPEASFISYNHAWKLLANDAEGLDIQFLTVSSKDLRKLDEIECKNYLIKEASIDPGIFETIADLKSIKNLYFCECENISTTGLKQICKSPSLKSIHFQNMDIQSDWLPVLTESSLVAVSFKDSQVTAQTIDMIKTAPRLRYLNLESQNPAPAKDLQIAQEWIRQKASDGSVWYCHRKR